jgi:hypothetical protein
MSRAEKIVCRKSSLSLGRGASLTSERSLTKPRASRRHYRRQGEREGERDRERQIERGREREDDLHRVADEMRQHWLEQRRVLNMELGECDANGAPGLVFGEGGEDGRQTAETLIALSIATASSSDTAPPDRESNSYGGVRRGEGEERTAPGGFFCGTLWAVRWERRDGRERGRGPPPPEARERACPTRHRRQSRLDDRCNRCEQEPRNLPRKGDREGKRGRETGRERGMAAELAHLAAVGRPWTNPKARSKKVARPIDISREQRVAWIRPTRLARVCRGGEEAGGGHGVRRDQVKSDPKVFLIRGGSWLPKEWGQIFAQELAELDALWGLELAQVALRFDEKEIGCEELNEWISLRAKEVDGDGPRPLQRLVREEGGKISWPLCQQIPRDIDWRRIFVRESSGEKRTGDGDAKESRPLQWLGEGGSPRHSGTESDRVTRPRWSPYQRHTSTTTNW